MTFLQKFTAKRKRFPGANERLHKYYYFGDDQIWYKSYRGADGFESISKLLDKIYRSHERLTDDLNKSLRSYAVVVFASLLFYEGYLNSFNVFGMSLPKAATSAALLLVMSVQITYIAAIQAKRFPIRSIFSQHYQSGGGAQRTRLLIEYPEAYDFIRFRISYEILPYPLHASHGLFGLLLMAVFMAFAAILTLIATLYVSIGLSLSVWNSKYLGDFGRLIVVSSLGMQIFAWLVPQSAIFKKRYSHLGLVYLLNSLDKRNPTKYSKYVSSIYEAHRKMWGE